MAERYWCNPPGLRLTLCIEPGAENFAREMLTGFLDNTVQLLRPQAGGQLLSQVTHLEVTGICRLSLRVPAQIDVDQAIAELEAMLRRARTCQEMKFDVKYFFALVQGDSRGRTLLQTVKLLRRRRRRKARTMAQAL